MFKFKKAISLLLVAGLAVSTLAGCSKETKKEESTGGKVTTDSTKGTDSTTDEDKVETIKWYVNAEWYSKTWDEVNTAVDKMITENTGLRIEFTSGKSEKLSALIAAGDLPDVITTGYNEPQASLLQQEGMVLPLNELIEKYTPDFKVPDSMQKWHGLNGNFYGIVNFFYAPERLKENEYLPTHTTMLARKDIMDQLGIKPEDFNTKEGTLAALKKVKENEVMFNGFKMQPAFFEHYQLMQMFGARREDENGNYVDRAEEPESLEAYKFLNQLYREGLLTEEFLTLNDEQKRQKVGQGIAFSFSRSTMHNGQIPVLAGIDENAYFVGVGPMKGDAAKEQYFDPSPMAGWLTTMINSETKHEEKIIKLFKYLYEDDEMHLNMLYGPKGTTWDYDENGKVKLFPEVKKEMDDNAEAAKLKYGQDTMMMFYDWIPVLRTLPLPTTVPEIAADDADQYFRSFTYPDLAFSKLNPPAGTDLAATRVRIKEYTKQMAPKLIMASSEQEVEKLWDEMLAKKRELGYDELFKFQSEQFKLAKEKLAVDFAWPSNQK